MKTIRCQSCLGKGKRRKFGNMGTEDCRVCHAAGVMTINEDEKDTLIPTNFKDAIVPIDPLKKVDLIQVIKEDEPKKPTKIKKKKKAKK